MTLLELIETAPLETISEQLEDGADPNIQNEDGLTPLHLALQRQRYDIAEQLMRHDAKLLPDINGKTPFMLAIEQEDTDAIVCLLENLSLDDLLLLDVFQMNVLHYAIKCDKLKIVKQLLADQRFHPHILDTDCFGRNAIDLAMEFPSENKMGYIILLAKPIRLDIQHYIDTCPIPPQIDQTLLNENLMNYLTYQNEETIAKDIIYELGNCMGWRFLFLVYASDGHPEIFLAILQYIGSWEAGIETPMPDSLKILYGDEEQLFDTVIHCLVIAQKSSKIFRELQLSNQAHTHHMQIRDYELLSDPARGRSLRSLFSLPSAQYNEAQLTEIINYFLNWPGISIDLNKMNTPTDAHATAIQISADDQFIYYDPNDCLPLAPFPTSSAAAKYILSSDCSRHEFETEIASTYFIEFFAHQFYAPDQENIEKPVPTTRIMYDPSSPNDFSPLHCAILNNDEQQVLECLQNKPELIRLRDAHQRTALHLAVGFNNPTIIATLIKYHQLENFELDIKDKNHDTPLLIAARKSTPDTIQQLVNAGAKWDQYDKNNFSVLMNLAIFQSSSIRQLQGWENTINYRDDTNTSALDFIIKYNDVNSLKLMIDKGAQPNLNNLRQAASINLEMVKIIHQAGIACNLQCLMTAVYYGQIPVIAYILGYVKEAFLKTEDPSLLNFYNGILTGNTDKLQKYLIIKTLCEDPEVKTLLLNRLIDGKTLLDRVHDNKLEMAEQFLTQQMRPIVPPKPKMRLPLQDPNTTPVPEPRIKPKPTPIVFSDSGAPNQNLVQDEISFSTENKPRRS